MIHHKKTYENVFSTDRPKSITRLQTEKISVVDMEINDYTSLFHNFLQESYSDLFLSCVKLSWLRRKFKYKDKKINFPIYKNSGFLQNSFTKFLRRYIGNDLQIITKGHYFSKLESFYFDELFPGFEEGNPFENPEYYKFPYKNISIEFLTVIYQLDDRFELLKKADDDKMSYAIFLDYIINHILSENERLNRTRYSITQKLNRGTPYFVRDDDKKFKAKKGAKRE